MLKIKSSPDGKPRVSTFDGDEGAVHVPQSEDARREVAGLMNVACNIMNAQTNSNIAGVVFDALTGAYILSLPETKINESVFMRTRMVLENKDSLEKLNERLEKYDIPKDSGRALLSALFPKDFYYTKGETVIKDGILVSGVLDKSNIGSESGTIIQALYKDYGQERTVDFLTDIYRTAGIYLDAHGFSIGIDDCYLSGKDPQKIIDFEVQRANMLVKSMGVKLKNPIEEERREKQILAFLDTAKNFGAKISKEQLSPTNAFNIMARSGAKGSVTNIAQITGILGQQYLLGERMPGTLPYFSENDLNPAARGFVSNSFLTGLTPAEFFFVSASGRVGLVDTSTTTSSTGYLHHKFVKSLEDVKVFSDGSVRNAANVIFQFCYGDDGFDAGMIESVGTKTGNFTSFINLKRAASRINGKYGF